ncbi:hypothetical protein SLEP1_g9000 [Rubroshorea leprosula]|uniref:Peroxin/Ferlin domain-containing protein n=1 Tax=Rubroshorea leprosula TaxID=152421 RepID=A0AAV5IDF3_9ROSI|nr:hypothetical protein SLEP1_g9000 [Rubroshorea leprosula]
MTQVLLSNEYPQDFIHMAGQGWNGIELGFLPPEVEGSAPITTLSETSSDDSETELTDDATDLTKMESVFIVGVLDELKIRFNYNHQHDRSFIKVLLAEESSLCEFRALGGQVELSIRGNDMFIGTMLKSLEIEDLICHNRVSQPCYLARSFIRAIDADLSFNNIENKSFNSNDLSPREGDEKFYEAPENLFDSGDYTTLSSDNMSEYPSSQISLSLGSPSLKTPSFLHIAGLLPDDNILSKREDIEISDTLDSFVKAQIVIYDRNSPLYNNNDMRVTVTLATLSFFCRRPTILAIMEFGNAITIKNESHESFSDSSSAVDTKQDVRRDLANAPQLLTTEEYVVKGLLGKGKSRIIFNLKLNMARAQILLMKEDETKLATLSQENLLTDIKVFPSSFSIKAALGNLRISDDSLPSSHLYFRICDMRDTGGTSFVELLFTSFSVDDEDYEGYEYSLSGQLSEVQIVYLNRFVQEAIGYFLGLVPKDSNDVVKFKDQGTNSEKWFTTSEIEGLPALKLDLSLRKPIILMPRKTDSLDYLKLDIVHITVCNTFQWFSGSKKDLTAVHLEILTIVVEDINLNVGTGSDVGESIIQDVKGVSVVIQRSLRDLLHQVPRIEAAIKIEKLKAALSNREYQIVTECALSNISETPNVVPPLSSDSTSSVEIAGPVIPQDPVAIESGTLNSETWIVMKVSVVVKLVELCLYTGVARDTPLSTVQASEAWLLYKSNTLDEGFLSASLRGFSMIDDREGTEEEFRLAMGLSEDIGYSPLPFMADNDNQKVVYSDVREENNVKPFPTMLILDAKFGQFLTSMSVCVQRPQLLVALDFMFAVVEFFVPTIGSMLSDEEDKRTMQVFDAIILDQSTYRQPSAEISLSPRRPLIVDNERFDHFIYDGNGGILCLKDGQGADLSAPSVEAMIFVGSGKRLQFKNVIIKNGRYLDSCILLGSNSSYSASKDDQVYLEGGNENPKSDSLTDDANDLPSQSTVDRSKEFVIEMQAIGPELTFYNTLKDVGESPILSNKLLHAQLDAFGRLVLKGDTIEMTANALGLTMESNGITILEPFDTSINYSNACGKTKIHLSVSDIFMNFSFSILRLFLAVEEDILAFLRTTSKEITVVCSRFDRIGTIRNPDDDQTYAFWRPCAPPGFAILGDCLTPLDKPPTKGVLAVNTNHVRVKRPISFKRVWPPLAFEGISYQGETNSNLLANHFTMEGESCCSVWFPEAPEGYVALGCVVAPGRKQPPLAAVFCILARYVSTCPLRDCITINGTAKYPSTLAFWRVDNSFGTFLPSDSRTFSSLARSYELRHIMFGFSKVSPKQSGRLNSRASPGHGHILQSEGSLAVNSARRFEAVASFRLIWCNRGTSSRKKLSVWRPMVPLGMVYFGDIAVNGYEAPNTCIVLHDTGNEELFRAPLDFQLVGQIKKQRGMDNISFWLPQAPPGFVSLGCIACKGSPKEQDFSALRCIRTDMVTGDQFLDESVWDSSDTKQATEPFSIWTTGNELGTFFVRSHFKKPPRRFALKLADTNLQSGSDDTVIDAKIRTFSVSLFDDYGLMVPLCNISLGGVGFSLHGRTDCLNSTVSFSLAARSYNDKYESWEPLVEPVDAFLRYQYDSNAPGANSQLRFTSTRDLSLNVSVSNANMIIQAYESWNNLSHMHEYYKRQEALAPMHGTRSVTDVHHKRSYYIVPQNKLGQDIFIRAMEMRGLSNIIRMPSGDIKPIKVPVSKNMLDSHLKGKFCGKIRTMVTVVILDAQIPRVGGLTSPQYAVTVHLSPDHSFPNDLLLHQQSTRTCGRTSNCCLSPDFVLVNWSEIFCFKVDSPDHYLLELVVTDMGKGDAVGYFSSPLSKIAVHILGSSNQDAHVNSLMWIDLSSSTSVNTTQADETETSCGKLRCAIILSPKSAVEERSDIFKEGKESGFIQISPSKEGPWTAVWLNYAATAACWRFGNDIVASEVSVKDGNRYVNIRSLVSVCNSTDFVLDLCLVSKASSQITSTSSDASRPEDLLVDGDKIQTEEFFETQKYNPTIGLVSCSTQPNQQHSEGGDLYKATPEVVLPLGWEWMDDWHLDTSSVKTADGWVYAPDVKSLNWPESHDDLRFVNCVRQRRWIRNRKQILSDPNKELFIGQLQPGDKMPLPLSGLTPSGFYVFQLRPSLDGPDKYSWSSVVDERDQLDDSGEPKGKSEICVSALTESDKLLCCTQITGSSSGASSHKMWFCVSIQATEISKDIHSDPIQDWSLVVKSPLSFSNYLPLTAEYSVLEMRESGHFVACTRGIFHPGKTVKVYNADIRYPLFFSLLPRRGWLPLQEAVLISHPHQVPAKKISFRSPISGRIVQLILEQNFDKEQPTLAKIIRLYAPYWFSVARCPPLSFRLLKMAGKKHPRKISFPFHSKKDSVEILEEIAYEEISEGHTIVSVLNFKFLGLSASITESGNECFGPVKDLSPLGNMDGSQDLYANVGDGKYLRLFISTKPCPYQSIPTKVIMVRPYMTFTNRLGQDLHIKFNSEDEGKVLHVSDSRVSFVHVEMGEIDKIQVRLEDTEWSFPVQIVKEDTFFLVLRRYNGTRTFLRTEVRGYEEGSRFIVVFRLGSSNGPIRIENRTNKTICICQSGFSEYAWTQLQPLSTTNFSWEDPYGQKVIDAKIDVDSDIGVQQIDFKKAGLCSAVGESGMHFHVIEMGDIVVARFTGDGTLGLSSHEEISSVTSTGKLQASTTPIEIIIELGVVGVSVVDHRPKELCYLYLESVSVAYSTGYEGGVTSRFKLILGHLQIDNQLPLTLMPVLLAPEQASDIHHPVFKMTVTMRNENTDGIQVYPYVYIRVTDKCWRLNIHEPIIWASVNFYNNLQLHRIPQSSSSTQVDPEIRVDLIDVSEVRLKISLQTAPAERPHGVLGVWSPILSAIGNAFKIQVHLRRVMHEDRFMRKSSILPAIGNRIWRDLIHNPLHLIFSVDVLGMTSSTLASLSKGFAELSTDGQFLQLRSKQVWSRRITGVGDGIIQGTEALAQGVAFGVSGVVTKPVESARQNGILGLAHGLGRAFLGIIVQPVSGALDFFSLTVDGIGASCSRCLEVLSNKTTFNRVRNPRAIHSDGVLREYSEKEAIGQMVLHLAEASQHFGCTEIFKEPSKFAWSDYYEDHFLVPYQRIVLVTNKRVMLLQCSALDKMDKKPSKIMWDVPWEELMTLELAKAGCQLPSHLILHLKSFKKTENFVRVIKCNVEEDEGREPQAVKICSVVRKMWKAYQSNLKNPVLKVPSSQKESRPPNKAIIKSSELSSSSSSSEGRKFVEHSMNFLKIWTSERQLKSLCSLCRKQVSEDSGMCSIWRPTCPDGYVSIGDIAHVGSHPPNVAAVYRNIDKLFTRPVGYDLVWRNCLDDYTAPVSIWCPRAPEGFIALGFVAVDSFTEPDLSLVYCVAETLAEETLFEEQKVWSAPDSYPWGCHVYQIGSQALHFVALRHKKEETDWKPMRVCDNFRPPESSSSEQFH